MKIYLVKLLKIDDNLILRMIIWLKINDNLIKLNQPGLPLWQSACCRCPAAPGFNKTGHWATKLDIVWQKGIFCKRENGQIQVHIKYEHVQITKVGTWPPPNPSLVPSGTHLRRWRRAPSEMENTLAIASLVYPHTTTWQTHLFVVSIRGDLLKTWLSAERKLTPVKLVSTSLTVGCFAFHWLTRRARRRRLAGLTPQRHKDNLNQGFIFDWRHKNMCFGVYRRVKADKEMST